MLMEGSVPTLSIGLKNPLDFMADVGLSSAERERVHRINLLPISDEKKNILVSHNVFLGAAPHMVELALGQPRFVTTSQTRNAQGELVEIWGYHFEEDGRPIVMEFQGNSLSAAKKMSYLDVESQYGMAPSQLMPATMQW